MPFFFLTQVLKEEKEINLVKAGSQLLWDQLCKGSQKLREKGISSWNCCSLQLTPQQSSQLYLFHSIIKDHKQPLSQARI